MRADEQWKIKLCQCHLANWGKSSTEDEQQAELQAETTLSTYACILVQKF